MKIKLTFLIFMAVTLIFGLSYDENNEHTTPEHLVSIDASTKLNSALQIIEEFSVKYQNRKILNLAKENKKIEVPIKKLYWEDALNLLLKIFDLEKEILPGTIIVKPPKEEVVEKIKVISADSKQIKISSIFLKTDKSLSKSVGIDWSTLVDGNVNATIDFKGGGSVADDIFEASFNKQLSSGNVTIDVNTLLKILESNQVGSVIARPNIVVIDEKNGYIQVGEDFSVKEVDNAGNTTDKFYSTGIIMDVTPTIIVGENEEAIHLSISVQKSSALPGAISTIVAKSKSNTEVLLYDGEETVISGLYDIDYTKVRSGIPFLKDLPWWVLGIRFLTGFTSYDEKSTEMMIILKAEIMDSITERRKKEKIINQQIQDVKDENLKTKQLFN